MGQIESYFYQNLLFIFLFNVYVEVKECNKDTIQESSTQGLS